MEAQELAKKGVLFATGSFINATEQQLSDACNGCGAAGSWIRPPSKLLGTEILPACNIHDWMYDTGKTIDDKNKADRVFLNNMLRLINRDRKWWSILQYMLANKYYQSVCLFGGPAFWSK